MKHIILQICLFLLVSSQSFGQQTHFIYLQTENREPFYVILNKKTYSSSSIGYAIIPKLQNGEYTLRVGFAKNGGTPQDYLLQVKDSEQGYLIKDFGEKGWAIFNLQSLSVQYAGSLVKERAEELAAQKAAEEKQKAEALAAEEAKQLAIQQAETKRRTDSIAAETARITALQEAEAKQKAEALAAETAKITAEKEALEKQKAEALAAENAKAEAAKTAAANALEEKNKSAAQKAKDAADLAAQKKEAAKLQAEATAKAKADKLAANKAAAALTAKQRKDRLDSINNAKTLAADTKNEQLKAEKEAARISAEKEAADKLAEKTAAEKLARKNAEEAAEKERVEKAAALAREKEIAAEKERNAVAVDVPSMVKPVNSEKSTVLINQSKTDSGLVYKYAVNDGQRWDTVSAFIKGDKPKKSVPADTEKKADIEVMTTSQTDGDIKFLDIKVGQDTGKHQSEEIVPVFKADPILAENTNTKPNVTINNVTTTTDGKTNYSSVPVVAGLPNSNCNGLSDEKDFFTLRKKMAAKEDADEMVMLAKKAMKERCYTTVQIRNLSVLFLNDAQRYQFLDAVYPFTYDAYQYNNLMDLLQDKYYIDRFKALIKKP